MLEFIFGAFMDPRKASINAGPFSILVDGATDKSVCELVAVYCRHLHEGKVTSTFIGIEELPTATADGYLKAIEKGKVNFDDNDVFFHNQGNFKINIRRNDTFKILFSHQQQNK